MASRCSRRSRRPAGPMTVVLGPGLARHPPPRGDRPRPRGRLQPQGHSRPSPAASASGSPRRACTVVDDGTIADRRGSLNVDDEGTPTGRTVLIENGILRGYLQDRLNARLMGSRPTGNGRRESYSSHPHAAHDEHVHARRPRTPRTSSAPSTAGLYARHFGGGQVDITSGKFVFSATRGVPDRGRPARRARRRARRSSATAPTCSRRSRASATTCGSTRASARAARTARACRSASGCPTVLRLGDHGRGDADLTARPATSYSAAHQSPKRQVRTGGPRTSSTTPVWMRSQRRLL